MRLFSKSTKEKKINENRCISELCKKATSIMNAYNKRYEDKAYDEMICLRNEKRGCSIPTKSAIKRDYEVWLANYLNNGGDITHRYQYDIGIEEWYIIEQDCIVYPLYGAQSKNYIVLESVENVCGNPGHSELYFMGDYDKAHKFVPIYGDLSFEGL